MGRLVTIHDARYNANMRDKGRRGFRIDVWSTSCIYPEALFMILMIERCMSK